MDCNSAVLIAEDVDTDILLYKRLFRLEKILNPVRFVFNGEELMHYLLGLGEYMDRIAFPLPGLILLDLKMHKVNGLEALAWIRADVRFKDIPVIIVSSSLLPRDYDRALAHGANGYFAKTIGFMGLMDTIREKAGLYFSSATHSELRV